MIEKKIKKEFLYILCNNSEFFAIFFDSSKEPGQHILVNKKMNFFIEVYSFKKNGPPSFSTC